MMSLHHGGVSSFPDPKIPRRPSAGRVFSQPLRLSGQHDALLQAYLLSKRIAPDIIFQFLPYAGPNIRGPFRSIVNLCVQIPPCGRSMEQKPAIERSNIILRSAM